MANVVEYALKVNDTKAKKALKDTAKGADAAAKSAKNLDKTATVALKNAGDAAKGTKKKWMGLRKEAANADRLTGELSTGLGMFSGTAGSAARAASNFTGGVEGIARAMMLTNPLLIAGMVAIGVLTAAYEYFTASQKEAEEKQKEFIETAQKANATIKASREQIEGLSSAYAGLQSTLSEQSNEVEILRLQKRILKSQQAQDENGVRWNRRRLNNLKIEQKVENITKKRLSTFEKMLDNATKRGNEAQKIIAEHKKLESGGASILKTDQNRYNEAVKNAKVAKEQRREAKKILDEYKKGKGVIAEQVSEAEKHLKWAQKYKDAIKSQNDAEKKRLKTAKEYASQQKEIAKFIDNQLKPLEKIAQQTKKNSQDILVTEDQIKQVEIKKERSAAALILLRSKMLSFADKEKEIAKAHLTLDTAKLKENRLAIEAIQRKIQLVKDEETANKSALDTAKENLSNLRQQGASRKLLQEAADKLAEAEDTYSFQKEQRETKIETFKALARRLDLDHLVQLDITDEQRYQNKLKRIAAEQSKRKKASKIVNDTNAKLQKIFDDTEQKRIGIIAQKRKEAIETVLSGITSFVDNIVSPAGLVQQATSAIGNIFGELGGMVGSAVGGIIGGIARLGEKTPQEIQQEMTGFLEAFEKGIEMLPEVLGRLLPSFTIAISKGFVLAIPELIRQIVKGLENMAKNLIAGIREIFNVRGRLSEMAGNALGAVKDFFVGGSMRSGGRILSGCVLLQARLVLHRWPWFILARLLHLKADQDLKLLIGPLIK